MLPPVGTWQAESREMLAPHPPKGRASPQSRPSESLQLCPCVCAQESERLELMNAELKTQIEELKQERQQLILMLNRHRPTCIVRTDSVKTPDSEGNPLLEQLEKK